MHEKVKDGFRCFTPYDPQPDPSTIIFVHRQYAVLKASQSYKRRITWFSNYPLVSVAEYLGQFPGRRSHGNSGQCDDSYSRTPSATLDAIALATETQQRPKQIYTTLLSDETIQNQPRNSKQIHNKKYNVAKDQRIEESSHDSARANVADEMLKVINMTQSSNFVQVVTVTKDKMP